MPEPLTIPFSVPGIRTAANDAAELANQFNRAGKEAGKFATGPFQRLQSLQAQAARAGGASGAVRQDLAYLVRNAQQRVDKIQQGPQQSSTLQKLMGVVTSSRFSLGGGGAQAMPLVGKTLEALGLSEAAGPIGLAIGAIVGAAMALHALAESAAETARNFASLRDTTGTSGAQAGQLQLLGGAGGIGDIASLARSLHERITSDPLAMGQAQGMGVNAVGGPFGTLNAGRELIQTVKGLRNLQGDDRLYAARQMGAEQLLPLTRLSDKTLNKMQGDAALTGQIQSPEAAIQGQEMQAAEARLSNAKDNLFSAIGKPIIANFTEWMNTAADMINSVAKWIDDHKAIAAVGSKLASLVFSVDVAVAKTAIDALTFLFRGVADGFEKLAEWGEKNKGIVEFVDRLIRTLNAYSAGGIGKAMQAWNQKGDSGGGDSSGASTDSRATAIDMNTQALGQTTTALRQLHGKIGGGEYAAGALPSSLGGMNLRRAYDMHALNLSIL